MPITDGTGTRKIPDRASYRTWRKKHGPPPSASGVYLLVSCCGLIFRAPHINTSSRYNNLFHANPQTNTLLGLAFSLLVNLDLYVPFKCSESHEKFVGEIKIAVTCNLNWTRSSEPSMEERRAVLGCFYLFSCVRCSNFHYSYSRAYL